MVVRILKPGKLVVASHNKGKIAEINELLNPFGFDIQSAADLDLPEPEETGLTFEENAKIKALASTLTTSLPALADDSGFCVDALNGDPGIYSARWSGPTRDFSIAMDLVEEKLQQAQALTPKLRSAKFVAVLCLAWPDRHTEFFRGEVEGIVVNPPRGSQGFGYDPIFQPNGYTVTFGEMDSQQKHGWSLKQPNSALSHRARAFEKFARTCLIQS